MGRSGRSAERGPSGPAAGRERDVSEAQPTDAPAACAERGPSGPAAGRERDA